MSVPSFMYSGVSPAVQELTQMLDEIGGGDARLSNIELHCLIHPTDNSANNRQIIWSGNRAIGIRNIDLPSSAPVAASMKYFEVSSATAFIKRDHTYLTSLPISDISKWVSDGFNGTIISFGERDTFKTVTLFGNDDKASSIGDIYSNHYPQCVVMGILMDLYAQQASDNISIGLSCWSLCGNELTDLFDLSERRPPSRSPGKSDEEFVTIECPDIESAISCLKLARKKCPGSLAYQSSDYSPNEALRSHFFARIVVHHPQPTGGRVSCLHVIDLLGNAPVGDIAHGRLNEDDRIARRVNSIQLNTLTKVLQEMKDISRSAEQGVDIQGSQFSAEAKMTSARESRLTTVLAPILQGNSKTWVLGFLRDGEKNFQQSMNTLRALDGIVDIRSPCHRTCGIPLKALNFIPYRQILPPKHYMNDIKLETLSPKAARVHSALDELERLSRLDDFSEQKNVATYPGIPEQTSNILEKVKDDLNKVDNNSDSPSKYMSSSQTILPFDALVKQFNVTIDSELSPTVHGSIRNDSSRVTTAFKEELPPIPMVNHNRDFKKNEFPPYPGERSTEVHSAADRFREAQRSYDLLALQIQQNNSFSTTAGDYGEAYYDKFPSDGNPQNGDAVLQAVRNEYYSTNYDNNEDDAAQEYFMKKDDGLQHSYSDYQSNFHGEPDSNAVEPSDKLETHNSPGIESSNGVMNNGYSNIPFSMKDIQRYIDEQVETRLQTIQFQGEVTNNGNSFPRENKTRYDSFTDNQSSPAAVVAEPLNQDINTASDNEDEDAVANSEDKKELLKEIVRQSHSDNVQNVTNSLTSAIKMEHQLRKKSEDKLASALESLEEEKVKSSLVIDDLRVECNKLKSLLRQTASGSGNGLDEILRYFESEMKILASENYSLRTRNTELENALESNISYENLDRSINIDTSNMSAKYSETPKIKTAMLTWGSNKSNLAEITALDLQRSPQAKAFNQKAKTLKKDSVLWKSMDGMTSISGSNYETAEIRVLKGLLKKAKKDIEIMTFKFEEAKRVERKGSICIKLFDDCSNKLLVANAEVEKLKQDVDHEREIRYNKERDILLLQNEIKILLMSDNDLRSERSRTLAELAHLRQRVREIDIERANTRGYEKFIKKHVEQKWGSTTKKEPTTTPVAGRSNISKLSPSRESRSRGNGSLISNSKEQGPQMFISASSRPNRSLIESSNGSVSGISHSEKYMPQMEQISYADSVIPDDPNSFKSQLLSSDKKLSTRKSPPVFPFQKQRLSNPNHGSQIDSSVGDDNRSLIGRGVIGVSGLSNAQYIRLEESEPLSPALESSFLALKDTIAINSPQLLPLVGKLGAELKTERAQSVQQRAAMLAELQKEQYSNAVGGQSSSATKWKKTSPSNIKK